MGLALDEIFLVINNNELGTGENGKRNYEDLLDQIYQKTDAKKQEAIESLYKRIKHHWTVLNVNPETVFRTFDPMKDGHLNIHNFGLALIQTHLNLRPEEIEAIRDNVQKLPDGRLSYQQFLYQVYNA
jgi:hypothetical protein